MPNWFCSRESVKRALRISGIAQDRFVDEAIEGMSREIERWTRRIFIPKTQTRLYEWFPGQSTESYVLWLDFDLISVTTLQTKAQDSSPTTIASTDFFTEPNNYGPPYNRIEIDLSSNAAFESGDTSQRSISVAGSWGYSNNTKSTGVIDDSSGISASDTALIVSNASLIDVGDTLLIGSEQIFVAERAFAALGSVLINDASFTSSVADNVLTVDGSHGIVAGEVIRLESEQLFVEAVSTNDLTVTRAYNGLSLIHISEPTRPY